MTVPASRPVSTMKIYLPKQPPYSDHASIRRNGMWYLHWQAGYADILKKGHPKPEDDETILAELHSPDIDDFLLGSTSRVPFLVSGRARSVLEAGDLSGFRFAAVEVVKIATKGGRKAGSKSGEPEDAILKSRNRLGVVRPPELYAVYVTGLVNALPEYSSGRSPVDWVSPFSLDLSGKDIPDLFRPFHDGKPFSAWSFCSERFVNAVSGAELTNISFEPLETFMDKFREETKREIEQRNT